MIKGKQKAYLMSLANKMKPVFQMGKGGVKEEQVADILNYLNKHELMKLTILNNCMEDLDYIMTVLENNQIEVVTKIGNNLLLYKKNPKLKDSIILP